VDATRSSDPAVAFGVAYSIAVVVIAVIDAMTALVPGLEERVDQIVGPAWLYMALLGTILFAVLGLAGVGRGLGRRRVASLVIGSTILSGLIIVFAGAWAGLSGSF
jgi:hypothetical protein